MTSLVLCGLFDCWFFFGCQFFHFAFFQVDIHVTSVTSGLHQAIPSAYVFSEKCLACVFPLRVTCTDTFYRHAMLGNFVLHSRECFAVVFGVQCGDLLFGCFCSKPLDYFRLNNTYMVVDLEQKLSYLFHFLKEHLDSKIICYFLTCNLVEYMKKVQKSQLFVASISNSYVLI